MSEGGVIRYRCRMCGVEFDGVHTPDLFGSLVFASIGLDMNTKVNDQAMAPDTLFEEHTCGDGRRGVADMIGGLEDREEKKEEGE